MGYQYGATRANPAGQLRNIQEQIAEARERLDFYLERTAEARREDHRMQNVLRRNKVRAAEKAAKQARPLTPEEFRAEAEAAYRKAMHTFPDSVQDGNDRRTVLLREVAAHKGRGSQA